MRISDWSSDVCSSDLVQILLVAGEAVEEEQRRVQAGTGGGVEDRVERAVFGGNGEGAHAGGIGGVGRGVAGDGGVDRRFLGGGGYGQRQRDCQYADLFHAPQPLLLLPERRC